MLFDYLHFTSLNHTACALLILISYYMANIALVRYKLVPLSSDQKIHNERNKNISQSQAIVVKDIHFGCGLIDLSTTVINAVVIQLRKIQPNRMKWGLTGEPHLLIRLHSQLTLGFYVNCCLSFNMFFFIDSICVYNHFRGSFKFLSAKCMQWIFRSAFDHLHCLCCLIYMQHEKRIE